MKKLLQELLGILAATALILGIIFTGMNLILDETWIESHSILIFTNGVYLYLFPLVVWVVAKNTKTPSFESPKVRKVLEEGILLIDRCEWMGHQTLVAIYKIDEDIERLLGAGSVHNIQSNGLIQLKVVLGEGEKFDAERFSEMRQNLKIKPGVVR